MLGKGEKKEKISEGKNGGQSKTVHNLVLQKKKMFLQRRHKNIALFLKAAQREGADEIKT